MKGLWLAFDHPALNKTTAVPPSEGLFHKVLRCLKANWIWSQETGKLKPKLNTLHVGWYVYNKCTSTYQK